MIFLFDTFFTIVILNWTALFPEMYPTLEQRARVSALRQILGIPSLLIGVAATPVIVAKLGWQKMGVIFAIVGGSLLYLSLLGVRENPTFYRKESLKLSEAIKHTFLNKSFITYVSASFLLQYTYTALLAALPFYAKYVLRLNETQTTLLLAMIFIVTFLLVPVCEVHTENRCEENDDGFNDPLGDPSQRVCIHQNFHPRIDIGLQSCDQPCRIVHRSGHHDRRNSRRRRGQNR